MGSLRDSIQANGPIWLAAGGFLIGLLFGAVVYRTNFCTMGALSDILNFGDRRRFRASLLAAGVALAGTQALAYAGVVDLSRSMYLTPSLNWSGHIIGGLIFGFGMVLAGGCTSRNLVRAGGGDLRSLVTLIVIGLTAYMAIGGILGPMRAALEQATTYPLPAPSQSLADLAARVSGADPVKAGLALTAGLTAVILAYCFASGEFRSSATHVLSGLGVGGFVVMSWLLTGLAFDELADRPTSPISLTFVRPSGDTIEWLARYTAAPMPAFGVASVLGALAGAALAAVAMGRFRWLTYTDVPDTLRNLAGAAMMGIGGVMALGCTIGQGVTGLSTLAVGSFLTFGSIVAGGFYGLKTLERWLMREA